MDGSFACPDCGSEIRLKGLSPGRLVRCEWCRTEVEVPYLPRAETIKTMRRKRYAASRYRLPPWAWVLVTVLSLAIVVAGTRRVVTSRWRKAESDALASLIEKSRAAESSGRLGESLAILEGAIGQAESQTLEPPSLVDLRTRRDSLARREAEAQLDSLESHVKTDDPGRAVGRALTLLARARKDDALDGLEARVLTTVERFRLRWVEDLAKAASVAEREGHAGKALDFAERQYRTAEELSRGPRTHWQGRATDLARRIITRHGTVFDPVRGEFTLGSPSAYLGLLGPIMTDSLLDRGYLPRPPNALWDDLWSTVAPYRVSIDIVERQEANYFASRNRVSTIIAKVVLKNLGEPLWLADPVSRTSIPLVGIPAYQASRLSVGDHRSPESERLLYEDALKNLLPRLGSFLRRLPSCPSPSTAETSSTADLSDRPT